MYPAVWISIYDGLRGSKFGDEDGDVVRCRLTGKHICHEGVGTIVCCPKLR